VLRRRLLRRRHSLPVPFSQDYAAEHEAFVRAALRSRRLARRVARSQRLPLGYGVGLDERVVEYPWLLAQRPAGDVLDAGSALNHAHVLDALLPCMASLTIVTLVPEDESFPERGVAYTYADLRELPFAEASFDTIVSLSTLEHVGMDNSRFGATLPPAADPRAAVGAALAELRRVLRPGGVLLATVPYGVEENFGWFRQFDRNDIGDLLEALDARSVNITFYRYSRRGWQLSTAERAADSRYRDSTVDKARPRDLAVAARAVACVRAEI
jgi:SAM-dependent methyltransferase